MTHTSVRGMLVAATLTTTLVAALTACGGAPATTPGSSATGETPSAQAAGAVSAAHNDADVTFVQGMIPHHSQAVDMARLATGRASSDTVKQLAARIEQAQGPEIAQMQGFLSSWGVAAGAPMGGMNAGTMPGDPTTGGMSGMMSDQQMAQLAQSTGAAFDRMFLQMMITHHTGAVQMAQTELASGQSTDATALAQKIIGAQQAEIVEMTKLLGD